MTSATAAPADRLTNSGETPTTTEEAAMTSVKSTSAMDAPTELTISADLAPLRSALASLELIAEASPEVSQHFLGGLDSLVDLCRVDQGDFSACGTGEVRIVFQPSDRLRDFLAAAGAGNFKFDVAGI